MGGHVCGGADMQYPICEFGTLTSPYPAIQPDSFYGHGCVGVRYSTVHSISAYILIPKTVCFSLSFFLSSRVMHDDERCYLTWDMSMSN